MSPLVHRVGWMLVHSIWEDILVVCVLQIVLAVLVRKSPQARYLAACGALVAMALLPWLTFDAADLRARLRDHHAVRSAAAPEAQVPTLSPHAAIAEGNATRPAPSMRETIETPQAAPPFLSRALPILVMLWFAGLVLSTGRLWVRWRSVQRLIRQPFQLPAPLWKARFDQLMQRSGVDRIVRLGESAAVSVPIVAGWLKPVILLPLGVMTSLPTEQVEAILLHELAHIARCDYLTNLLQSIVETVFFYHPAVWIVSNRIRLERELACDDQTVRWCASALTYAKALAGFEEFRIRPPLLAATGGGGLFTRIQRILNGPQRDRRGAGIIATAGFCGIGIYLSSMFLLPVLAESVITAKERIALIQALEPPPPGPESSSLPPEDVSVNGTIKTEDGRPLPETLFDKNGNFKQAEAQVTSSHFGGSSGGGFYMNNGAHDDTFGANTKSGRIEIGIWAEGYAPVRKTVLQSKGGEVKVNFVLKRGFPGRVRFTGSDGQPLDDVMVTAISFHSGERLELSMPTVHTDAKGFATFGNVEADSEIQLLASKPGWQMTRQVISHWSDQTPLLRELEPAAATAGLVLYQITRKPIPGARIILAACRETGDSQTKTYDPTNGQTLGKSDQTGRFVLENLSKDSSYSIYVQAAGYPIETFPIGYGDQNRICEMPPGLHIRGKILDREAVLASKTICHPIALQCMYTIDATPFAGYGQNERKSLLNLGPEIPFSFEHLPKGRIGIVFAVLGLVKYRYEIDLEKDIDDYGIDLSAKLPENWRAAPDPRPLRNVEITIKTDSESSPAGFLDTGYETTEKGQTWNTPRILPIMSGKTATALPVPTKMNLSANHLIGYWFAPQKFDVPAGAEPYACIVEATGAGVIHGKVTVPPALKKRALSVSGIAIKRPPGIKSFDGPYVPLSEKSDYVTAPLPLGGTYSTVLDAAPSYFVSAPALVDAEHSVVVRDLDVAVPQDSIKGKFIDELNEPIAYQDMLLTYHPTEEDVFLSVAGVTGSDGTFTIPNINFSVPGGYEVQLHGNGWEKTKLRIDAHTPQPLIIPVRRVPKR